MSADPPTEPLEDLHRLVGLPRPRYTRADVERLTGVPDEQATGWWRAMGFPNAGEDEVVFTAADVLLVRQLAERLEQGLFDEEHVLRLARVMGAAFSRVAGAQVDTLAEMVDRVGFDDAPGTDRLQRIIGQDEAWDLSVLVDSVLYVWRRHLLAALAGAASTDGTTTEQAVGFVDIVQFTALSDQLEDDELGQLVDEFESAATDSVAAHGGQVVKFIGDEVLFVAPSLDVGVDIALDLVDRADDAPEVRCGLAFGPTVGLGGDVFGPTVNLAARLTSVARPGRVLLPQDQSEQLGERTDLVVKRVGRKYDLKGIGSTRVASVVRAVQG
jgi:adenylate cyclase